MCYVTTIKYSKKLWKNKAMNQNKQHYKKCLICDSNEWTERDDEEDIQ